MPLSNTVIKENNQITNITSSLVCNSKIPVEDNLLSTNLYESSKLVCSPVPTKPSITNEKSKFPESFDPRNEKNMPQKEKVDNWIAAVPTLPVDEACTGWYSDCYNPTIPTSEELSECSSSEMNFETNKDIIYYQSKMITFLVNKGYYHDAENIRSKDGKYLPILHNSTQYTPNTYYHNYFSGVAFQSFGN